MFDKIQLWIRKKRRSHKNSQNSQENTCTRPSFFNKAAGLLLLTKAVSKSNYIFLHLMSSILANRKRYLAVVSKINRIIVLPGANLIFNPSEKGILSVLQPATKHFEAFLRSSITPLRYKWSGARLLSLKTEWASCLILLHCPRLPHNVRLRILRNKEI